VAASEQIGGATYLVLKTHMTGRMGEEDGLGDKKSRVTDARVVEDSEETAPTDPARHLQHERREGVVTITGKDRKRDLPVLVTITFLKERTVLVPKS